MTTERETVAVVLGDTTVIVPLADAIAEYFRLSTVITPTAEENRILAALTITLGTLNTTWYESGVNEPLRDAVRENSS